MQLVNNCNCCIHKLWIFFTIAGLDISIRPLTQASIKTVGQSTNHGSLAQFSEYDFHHQKILFKTSVTFYFPLGTSWLFTNVAEELNSETTKNNNS